MYALCRSRICLEIESLDEMHFLRYGCHFGSYMFEVERDTLVCARYMMRVKVHHLFTLGHHFHEGSGVPPVSNH
jgi:hypothetical protein